MPKKNEKTPIVVSIINLKGGVGKTTIAALLARHAAAKGLNVLAVDLDPQSNLSQALMTENEYRGFMESGGGFHCRTFEWVQAAFSPTNCSYLH